MSWSRRRSLPSCWGSPSRALVPSSWFRLTSDPWRVASRGAQGGSRAASSLEALPPPSTWPLPSTSPLPSTCPLPSHLSLLVHMLGPRVPVQLSAGSWS